MVQSVLCLKVQVFTELIHVALARVQLQPSQRALHQQVQHRVQLLRQVLARQLVRLHQVIKKLHA